MPRIFDNIALDLLPALRETLKISQRSDFCVGYFNLRGWKGIDDLIDKWAGGSGQQCRLLVGMQRLPQQELREAYSLLPQDDQMSNQAVIRLKRRLAEEFREQLTIGAPTDNDKVGLRRLSARLYDAILAEFQEDLLGFTALDLAERTFRGEEMAKILTEAAADQ